MPGEPRDSFPELPGSSTDLRSDLARTHRATRSGAANRVPSDLLEEDLRRLSERGYVIVDALLSDAQLREIRAQLSPFLQQVGRNEFEGLATQRVYSLLRKTRSVDPLIEHPRVLALLDALLLPNYLISQAQAINILPGESAQAYHPDDGFYPVPRPRRALSVATIWAIDEFSGENGSTRLIEGSHRWPGDRVPSESDEAVSVRMRAGSVVIFLGTLWHGGGANRSERARLAVTCQYCEPWLRTQENFFLSMPRAVARELSEDMLRMLGYSIHPPFMGMVDGMHPKRSLFERD